MQVHWHREMAADETRERDAMEWSEGLIESLIRNPKT